MEQSGNVHPDYQKGFNEGYLLAKHMPELTDQVTKSLGNSERSEGFKHGVEQFSMEKLKANYPSWVKGDRLSSLDKEEDKSKDQEKDNLERE